MFEFRLKYHPKKKRKKISKKKGPLGLVSIGPDQATRPDPIRRWPSWSEWVGAPVPREPPRPSWHHSSSLRHVTSNQQLSTVQYINLSLNAIDRWPIHTRGLIKRAPGIGVLIALWVRKKMQAVTVASATPSSSAEAIVTQYEELPEFLRKGLSLAAHWAREHLNPSLRDKSQWLSMDTAASTLRDYWTGDAVSTF